MAEVSLQNVSKSFGKVQAVKNLTLSCKDREFLALLGPSGCGKTTTLRMIVGLEVPSKGDIYIGDRLVNHLEPQQRDVAMVFETYGLYPHFTVYENMAYPLKIRKVSSEERRKRVRRIARVLRIDDVLDRMPRQLSGGQKQRVGLGRALVREPAVTLMDEPISHLDAKLRYEMRGELKRIHQELGNTTIYVTHDQLEAVALADRIAVMRLGELQQLGHPDEIYSQPVNEFVAAFVGAPPINFIDCQVKSDKGRLFLRHDDFIKIPLADQQQERLSKLSLQTNEVRLGIRPQDIDISSHKDRSHCVQVSVYITELFGDRLVVTAKIREVRLKIETSPDLTVRMDQPIWLNFDKSKFHFFDPRTRLRIV